MVHCSRYYLYCSHNADLASSTAMGAVAWQRHMPPEDRSVISGPHSRFFLYSALLVRKVEIGQCFATATAAEHLLRAHGVGLNFLGACWGESSYMAGHTRQGNIACASFLGDLASFWCVNDSVDGLFLLQSPPQCSKAKTGKPFRQGVWKDGQTW